MSDDDEIARLPIVPVVGWTGDGQPAAECEYVY